MEHRSGSYESWRVGGFRQSWFNPRRCSKHVHKLWLVSSTDLCLHGTGFRASPLPNPLRVRSSYLDDRSTVDRVDCWTVTKEKGLCHLSMHKIVRTVCNVQKVSNYLVRALDTSPIEEGNPERKGMRNGKTVHVSDCVAWSTDTVQRRRRLATSEKQTGTWVKGLHKSGEEVTILDR